MASLPKQMKALRYEKPEDWSIVTVPLPEMRDSDVLIQVKACGHIHEGEFIAKFPLIPGHETVGVVAAVGKDVKDFKVGDRVAADNSELCNECFYCRRGQLLLCENFNAHGVTMNGGFAEYCAYPAAKVFKFHNLSWVDATLLEPASCACHGLEKIRPKLGSHVLMFGAGPTGLVSIAVSTLWKAASNHDVKMLAQLLRQNGGCQVTVAAPKGLKMELAKSLDAADTYIELSRESPEAQFEQLKKDNPYGFDVVVEATGSIKILEDAINYVRRGGTLVVYGVYSSSAKVSWPPAKIFGDEITIIGSFSETYMFPATIDYLDSGKVKTKGIVNKTFKLEDFGKALESIKDKSAIKAAIVFE
ncbi:D-arabinitol dehydrogenase 1 [Tolypocladium capitatum]|uniref:D-arabinitol dehydrogenase 1 n=1 Tax=Tolypocladium capitatum TaxID=45235 RepID=A0A2K3QLV2_9HYPO|nr:D-arabinitol dehydrogenase 1 [Tolypocladium capitatum]